MCKADMARIGGGVQEEGGGYSGCWCSGASGLGLWCRPAAPTAPGRTYLPPDRHQLWWWPERWGLKPSWPWPRWWWWWPPWWGCSGWTGGWAPLTAAGMAPTFVTFQPPRMRKVSSWSFFPFHTFTFYCWPTWLKKEYMVVRSVTVCTWVRGVLAAFSWENGLHWKKWRLSASSTHYQETLDNRQKTYHNITSFRSYLSKNQCLWAIANKFWYEGSLQVSIRRQIRFQHQFNWSPHQLYWQHIFTEHLPDWLYPTMYCYNFKLKRYMSNIVIFLINLQHGYLLIGMKTSEQK